MWALINTLASGPANVGALLVTLFPQILTWLIPLLFWVWAQISLPQ